MADRTILIQNPHNLVQAFVRSPALWDLLPRKPGKKCVSRSFVADQTNCSHNTAMLRRNLLIMDGSPPDVVDRGIVRQAGFFGPSCRLSPDSCGRKWQEAAQGAGCVASRRAMAWRHRAQRLRAAGGRDADHALRVRAHAPRVERQCRRPGDRGGDLAFHGAGRCGVRFSSNP